MELSPTAYVILGMLGMRPMSGYDIKGLVDNSTRFFWAASYGQIYPELRRLKDGGLIAGATEPGSRRGRTVYRLTAEGRTQLREWLATDPEAFETRDEGLLKLFFAAGSGGRDAAGALAAKREHHERIAERLRELEPKVAESDRGFQYLVLSYGIECNQWAAQWCERAMKTLDDAGRKAA